MCCRLPGRLPCAGGPARLAGGHALLGTTLQDPGRTAPTLVRLGLPLVQRLGGGLNDRVLKALEPQELHALARLRAGAQRDARLGEHGAARRLAHRLQQHQVDLVHKAVHVRRGQQHRLLHQALDAALGRHQVRLEAIGLAADLQERRGGGARLRQGGIAWECVRRLPSHEHQETAYGHDTTFISSSAPLSGPGMQAGTVGCATWQAGLTSRTYALVKRFSMGILCSDSGSEPSTTARILKAVVASCSKGAALAQQALQR